MHYPREFAAMTTSHAHALVSGSRKPAADQRCVLVVDDESAVRMVVARALESAGYDVIGAADGAEALELLECRRAGIDLVVTDIRMPRLGGLALGREIAVRQWPIPILYMSADPPEALDGGDSSTATASSLRKPFSIATLITVVDHLFAGEPQSPRPHHHAHRD